VQSGGGVRARKDADALLSRGVARVVVGSTAVREPAEVRTWIEEFGAERLCLAVDVRASGGGWEVAVNGWSAGAGKTLEEVLALYPPGTVRHALVTDVS